MNVFFIVLGILIAFNVLPILGYGYGLLEDHPDRKHIREKALTNFLGIHCVQLIAVFFFGGLYAGIWLIVTGIEGLS